VKARPEQLRGALSKAGSEFLSLVREVNWPQV
jgi:hypothetical protein